MKLTIARLFVVGLPFLALVLSAAEASAGFVTFGNGFGSKWDDPNHGTSATVTWGYMVDGTTVDPGIAISSEVIGGSDITQMRTDFDTTYGAGEFDAAIQRAMGTWSQWADITFVGPNVDPGTPVGAAGSTAPDIRIGAFNPVPASGFSFLGAVGFGPPGDDINFPDALAGDVMFNLTAGFIMPAGDEGDPIVEFGNDLENLTLHELGHAAMGLGHPVDGPGEVMYVGFDCCDVINRQPSPDDITGAHTVYGAAALIGDVSGNGSVGPDDYTLWADDFGQSGSHIAADISNNGVVGPEDYTLWADNFGMMLSGPQSVPEPSALLLLCMAVFGLGAKRSTRRRR